MVWQFHIFWMESGQGEYNCFYTTVYWLFFLSMYQACQASYSPRVHWCIMTTLWGGVSTRRVGMMLECSTSELLARAAFIHPVDQGHGALMHDAVLKGLRHLWEPPYGAAYYVHRHFLMERCLLLPNLPYQLLNRCKRIPAYWVFFFVFLFVSLNNGDGGV